MAKEIKRLLASWSTDVVVGSIPLITVHILKSWDAYVSIFRRTYPNNQAMYIMVLILYGFVQGTGSKTEFSTENKYSQITKLLLKTGGLTSKKGKLHVMSFI